MIPLRTQTLPRCKSTWVLVQLRSISHAHPPEQKPKKETNLFYWRTIKLDKHEGTNISTSRSDASARPTSKPSLTGTTTSPSALQAQAVAQRSNTQVSSQDAEESKPPRLLSIYEELFPFEAAADRAASLASSPSKPPTVPPKVPPSIIHASGPRITHYDPLPNSHSNRPSYPRDRIAVLILHSASPSLTESDFRRISPRQAKHIPEWTGGPGHILKVVPARDTRTLKQEGRYYLLFESVQHAIIYRDHISKCHRLAGEQLQRQQNSPRASSSTTSSDRHAEHQATPNGKDKWRDGDTGRGDGETTTMEDPPPPAQTNAQNHQTAEDDTARLLAANYSLIPPTQPLNTKVIRGPFTGTLRHIVENEGYKILTRGGSSGGNGTGKGNDRSGRAVRFGFEGCQTYGLVESVLRADGLERGMAWDCEAERVDGWGRGGGGGGGGPDEGKGRGKGGGDAIMEEKKNKRRGILGGEGDEEGDGEDGGKGEDDGHMASEEAWEREEAQMKVLRSKQQRVWWILTFKEEDDARRFVRWWHQRIVPLGRDMDETRATAELLW